MGRIWVGQGIDACLCDLSIMTAKLDFIINYSRPLIACPREWAAAGGTAGLVGRGDLGLVPPAAARFITLIPFVHYMVTSFSFITGIVN